MKRFYYSTYCSTVADTCNSKRKNWYKTKATCLAFGREGGGQGHVQDEVCALGFWVQVFGVRVLGEAKGERWHGAPRESLAIAEYDSYRRM